MAPQFPTSDIPKFQENKPAYTPACTQCLIVSCRLCVNSYFIREWIFQSELMKTIYNLNDTMVARFRGNHSLMHTLQDWDISVLRYPREKYQPTHLGNIIKWEKSQGKMIDMSQRIFWDPVKGEFFITWIEEACTVFSTLLHLIKKCEQLFGLIFQILLENTFRNEEGGKNWQRKKFR